MTRNKRAVQYFTCRNRRMDSNRQRRTKIRNLAIHHLRKMKASKS